MRSDGPPRMRRAVSCGSDCQTAPLILLTVGISVDGGCPVSASTPPLRIAGPPSAVVSSPPAIEALQPVLVPGLRSPSPLNAWMSLRPSDCVVDETADHEPYDSYSPMPRTWSLTAGSVSMPVGTPRR